MFNSIFYLKYLKTHLTIILGSVFNFSYTKFFLSFKCYSKISTKRILSVNIFLEVFLGESLIKYFS